VREGLSPRVSLKNPLVLGTLGGSLTRRSCFRAPSPSGKAEVCKTSTPGSNPGGASKFHQEDHASAFSAADCRTCYCSQVFLKCLRQTMESPGNGLTSCELWGVPSRQGSESPDLRPWGDDPVTRGRWGLQPHLSAGLSFAARARYG